jgi:hypothetical protein
MLKLVVASLLVLGFSLSANARSMRLPEPVFVVDHKTKVGDATMWRFELRSDGRWTFAGTTTKSGTLSRAQLQTIQRLVRTRWSVKTHEVACLAYAMEYTQYSVNGRMVWHDEMCSGTSLDRVSAKRLDQVMAIVRPLMNASA